MSYGDVNLEEKVSTLERELESSRQEPEERFCDDPGLEELNNLLDEFTQIVRKYSPAPFGARGISPSTNLREELLYSTMDLVKIDIEVADIYEVDSDSIGKTYRIGDLFADILDAVMTKWDPPTLDDLAAHIRTRTRRFLESWPGA